MDPVNLQKWALVLFDIDGCTMLLKASSLQLSGPMSSYEGSIATTELAKVNHKIEVLKLADSKNELNEFEIRWSKSERSEAIGQAKENHQVGGFTDIKCSPSPQHDSFDEFFPEYMDDVELAKVSTPQKMTTSDTILDEVQMIARKQDAMDLKVSDVIDIVSKLVHMMEARFARKSRTHKQTHRKSKPAGNVQPKTVDIPSSQVPIESPVLDLPAILPETPSVKEILCIPAPLNPTQFDPLQVEPTLLDPTPLDPVHAEPTMPDATPLDLVHAEPTMSDATPLDPVHAEPTMPEPTPLDPVHVEPTLVDSTPLAPVQVESPMLFPLQLTSILPFDQCPTDLFDFSSITELQTHTETEYVYTEPAIETHHAVPNAKRPCIQPVSSCGLLNIGPNRHPILVEKLKFLKCKQLPNEKRFVLSVLELVFSAEELKTSSLEGGRVKYNGVVVHKNKLCEMKLSAIFKQASLIYGLNEDDLKVRQDLRNSINAKCRAKRLLQ